MNQYNIDKDYSIVVEDNERELKTQIKSVIQEKNPKTKDELFMMVLQKIQNRKKWIDYLLNKYQKEQAAIVLSKSNSFYNKSVEVSQTFLE